MKKVQLAALAATALLAAAPARAAVVFSQDFSSGLGAKEQVSGEFAVADGKVGHSTYYARDAFAFYQLALDLTEVTDALLSLDFFGSTEAGYDGFNLVASTSEVFTPADLVAPTKADFYRTISGEPAKLLGTRGFSGTFAGPLTFDLSAFDGQIVNLRFQFASDYAVTGQGVQLDNLEVTGVVPVSAVPEPAAWALMIAGFGLVGATLRRRRAWAPQSA